MLDRLALSLVDRSEGPFFKDIVGLNVETRARSSAVEAFAKLIGCRFTDVLEWRRGPLCH